MLSACDSEPPLAEKESEAPVRPAKLIEIGQANSTEFLNYPAVIQSQQLSVLSFEVGGMVKELLVVESQQVRKGEMLAKLDQRDLLAALQSARAQFKQADTAFRRAIRLFKADAISRSKVEERKSTRDVNTAHLRTAKKALEDSVLVAPYSGRIATVSTEERQIIQPGKPAITILGTGGFEATINLPASILAKANTREKQANDSYIVLEAAPHRHIPAIFTEISLEADAASQTYELTFAFDVPKDLVILPGMNAVVWLKDPSKSALQANAIRIPLTAIATDGAQKYVWVVDIESMTVFRRNIIVQDGVGLTLNVTSGLQPGEMIVAAGISYLSEGMKVRPWSN